MALHGLTARVGQSSESEVGELTKHGVFIYDGSALHFDEWKFRTLARLSGTKPDDRPQLPARVLEGLRGEALRVAMDIGIAGLSKEGALQQLVDDLENLVLPLRSAEAAELYHEGAKPFGKLSRQRGEAMSAYIARRRRWWNKLNALDPDTMVSENILADMLLQGARLDRTERLMIMTTVNNEKNFEKIANALREQHSKLHLEETGRTVEERTDRNRGGPARKGNWRPRPSAYAGMAEYGEPDQPDAHPEPDNDLEPEGMDAYEAIELDVVAAYHEAGYDPEDAQDWVDADFDEIAYTAQVEQTAYFSQEKARAAGLRTGAYASRFKPTNELTLQDKKRKTQLVKSRSRCRACGKVGHWQGDKECSKHAGHSTPGSRPAGQPQRPTPSRGGAPQGKDPKGDGKNVTRTSYFAIVEETSASIEPTALMVVTSPDPKNKAKSSPKPMAKAQGQPPSTSGGQPEVHVIDDSAGESDLEFVDGDSAKFPENWHRIEYGEVDPVAKEAEDDDSEPDELPWGSGIVFDFGRYKGFTRWKITHDHPGYFFWGKTQKFPSRQLQEYLDWVTYVFEVDYDIRRITYGDYLVGQIGPATLGTPPLERAVARVFSHLSPDGPCVGGCKPDTVSTAGTNDRFIHRTCILCGYWSIEPRPLGPARASYERCAHKHCDFRGAYAVLHKFYCYDCHRLLDERPEFVEHEMKYSNKVVATQIQQGKINAYDLGIGVRNSKTDIPLESALQAARTFVRLAEREITRTMSEGRVGIKVSSLHSLLDDAVDITAESGPTGYMHTADNDASPEIMPGWGTQGGSAPIALEEIDPITDGRVFAVLDDGCNRTCHSAWWADHAEKKLQHLNRTIRWVNQSTVAYTGIGGVQNRSLGRREIPVGMQLTTGEYVCGLLESNELEQGESPLLLSLYAQGVLGMVKDVRDGICYLKDYKAYAKLYRVQKTGLHAICISEFETGYTHPCHQNSADAFWKQKLTAFYAKHNPVKVELVDSLMERYPGRGGDVYKTACDKYKVSPVTMEKVQDDKIDTAFDEEPVTETPAASSGEPVEPPQTEATTTHTAAPTTDDSEVVVPQLAQPKEEPVDAAPSSRRKSVDSPDAVIMAKCAKYAGPKALAHTTPVTSPGTVHPADEASGTRGTTAAVLVPRRCRTRNRVLTFDVAPPADDDSKPGARKISVDLDSSSPDSDDDDEPSSEDKSEVAFRESLAETSPVSLSIGPSADRAKFTPDYLNWYVWSGKPRSYVTWDHDIRLNIKYNTSDTAIKFPPALNSWYKSAYSRKVKSGGTMGEFVWVLIEEDVYMWHVTEVDKDVYDTVIVIAEPPHATSEHIAYLCVDVPQIGARSVMTTAQRKGYFEALENAKRSDEVMWANLADARGPRLNPSAVGSSTMLLEIFAGEMELTSRAADRGYPISQPADLGLDGINLQQKAWRDMVDTQIQRDDPFLIVVAFPCSPWGPWSRFNALRSDESADRIEQLRKSHLPMLKWVAGLARRRVLGGRVILLENSWFSEAWELECFLSLWDLDDPMTDEPFTVVRGDQCMYGQRDRESGVPVRGGTGWGTNSSNLKSYLSKLCDGSHDHQVLEGNNIFGSRSRQKAAWTPEIADAILDGIEAELSYRAPLMAFPASVAEEEAFEQGPLDAPDEDDDPTPLGTELPDLEEREMEELDAMQFDGMPADEAERRRIWMDQPRAARAAIRRLHRMLGFKPKNVLLHVLKGARADPSLITAAKAFRCSTQAELQRDQPIGPVKAPNQYAFNWEVGLDIFEIKDDAGERYSWLSIVCVGTTFHRALLVTVGGGQTSSKKCYDKFVTHWVGSYGWPTVVTTDRGLHNRGAFAKGLIANGVRLRQAGLEAPAQIGRVERHGGILKMNMKSVIRQHHVVGKRDMKLVGAECEQNKNNFVRQGGFAPAQWVLGKLPRGVGHMLDEQELGHLGVLHQQSDPSTEFGLRAQYRLASMKAFVFQDCGRRVAAGLLRKAAPLPGKYQQGDLVCYRREQGSNEAGSEWSGVARIIGFEGNVVWLQHGGTPVATAISKLRPVTSEEVLAYQILSRSTRFTPQGPESQVTQQGFLDERATRARDGGIDEDTVDADERPSQRRRVEASQQRVSQPEVPPVRTTGASTEVTTSSRARASEPASSSGDRRDRSRSLGRAPRQVSEPEPESELERVWSRTDPTGSLQARSLLQRALRGTSELDRPAQEEAVDAGEHASTGEADLDPRLDEYRAFMSTRVTSPDAIKWIKSRRKPTRKAREARGKTLRYEKLDSKSQAGLDESRLQEWTNYKKFNAVKVISRDEGDKLIAEGHEVIPMQWIETDKNEHLRRPGGPEVDPKFRSRMVSMGNFEKADIRSDSPTVDTEAQNLIFSFAASHNVPVRSLDVKNAYFQGEKLSRILLLRQPRGGVPDPEVRHDDYLLAQVPIYGTRDAGRGFWKKLRNVIVGVGLKENRVLNAFYSYADESGKVLMVLGSHVDDLLWANLPEAERLVDEIKNSFEFGSEESRNFRYCGKEVSQNPDGTVFITCKDTTEKLTAIRFPNGRSSTDLATESDITQLMSVIGSLSWIARQCRPELSYRVSRLQQNCRLGTTTVGHLREANKVINYAVSTADRGLTFKAGAVDWQNMVMLVCVDASHSNESAPVAPGGEPEPYRSQGARILALATTDAVKDESCNLHVIGYSSSTLKRVCRSTLQAEAYSLQLGVESGDVLRAAVADMRGHLLPGTAWESSAAASMQQIWFTDCKSLQESLTRDVLAKISDKRLGIELASMRQNLWRDTTELATDGPITIRDDRPPDDRCTDLVRWIDTDVMLCDPLTKSMDPCKLLSALDSNYWDLRQPTEAIARKRAKQEQRRSASTEPAGQ